MSLIRRSAGRENRGPGRGTFAGLILPAVALGMVAGCGGSDVPPVVKVYEVKGKVLLADKKPLTGGRVFFVPTQEPLLLSSGPVNADGSFSLATSNSGEGAPPGEYKIRVEPDTPVPQARTRPGTRRLPFPTKYLDEDSSGLMVSVKPESNQLPPFVLK